MLRFIAGLLLVVIMSVPAFAQNMFEAKAHEMLDRGAGVEVFKSKKTGLGIISIGHGSHRSPNKALEIARLDALKQLGAFLGGETVSGSESAQMSYQDGIAKESFFSKVSSNVQAFLKSTKVVASGDSGRESWVALAITEKNQFVRDSLMQLDTSNEVKARGVASLKPGVVKARKLALAQALRNAVEQYAGVQTASRSTVENNGKLHSGVAAISHGQVEKYSILKEYVKGKQYVIEIAARISEKENEHSLDAVKESLGRPSFYIATKDGRLTRMLQSALSKADYPVTSQKSSARYIVAAHVNKEQYDIPANSTMKGMRTEINISVSDSKNVRDVLFKISNDPEDSVEISANMELLERNSYRYALETIEEEFVSAINRTLNQQFNNGAKVLVQLTGFRNMDQINEFQRCLEALPLTKSVTSRPIVKHSIEFELIYLGNPDSLQVDVMKKAREFRLRRLGACGTKNGQLVFSYM
ncbi:hypothetical protein [Halodesulfovibrio sp. MK-HDV]|uniref:hypothetical protein n=1 Tax=Halodesulfovibrio sp. MK-HDV TaxID=2599925 RepID=UPI00136DA65D|nr:hypothetical protein [Halodesulfovibrio sp. MK-HDV]KAF1073759.1 hypothetical protein MKHDV_03380 [Halodesulfovibrio sp. MK-HDV]